MLTLLFFGCGGSGDRIGTWDLAGLVCGGHSVVVRGYSSQIIVTEAETTTIDRGGGCSVTQVFPGHAPMPSSIVCSPHPCTLRIELELLGKPHVDTFRCPSEFPLSVGGVHEEVDGDVLTQTSTGDVQCTATYHRRRP